MSVQYNNATNKINVDERYSAAFRPNLFYNTWLIDGVTYSSKYKTGPAGGFFVPKLTNDTRTVPGAPGRDFTDTLVQNDLLQIVLNNNYQESDKLYNVAVENIAAPVAAQTLANVTEKIKDGRAQSALACLYTEGTALTDTTAITKSNIKSQLIAARTAIVKKKGTANIVLCSPDVYGAILEQAGAEFTPTRNEKIQMEGRVGNWLGMTIFECNGLATSADEKYIDSSGTTKTVTAANFALIDFVMYNSEALSVLDNLEMYRLVDEPTRFNGVLAQAEVNTGFRVANTDLVVIKKHAASGTGG